MTKNIPNVIMLPLHRYIDSSWGSESAWAINLAKSVAMQRISFTAVVGEADNQAKESIRSTGNEVIEIGVGQNQDLTSHLLFYSKLFSVGVRLARKVRPCIIHHVLPLGFKAGFNPYVLCSDKPSVVGPLLFPSSDTEDEPMLMKQLGVWKRHPSRFPAMMKILFSELYRQTLLRCSYVLFDSEQTRELIVNLEPRLRTKRYALIPTGGVADFNYKKGEAPSGKRQLTVGVLAYLRRRKHVDTLIRALSFLRNDSVRVLIGGDGPLFSKLCSLTRELDVEDKVKFLGRIPHNKVPSFLHGVDVFCQLDRVPHEALRSIQEAMMCGNPIIASTPSQYSSIQKLPYGFIVDTERAEDVAYCIEHFLENPETILTMGLTARKFAEQNFSNQSVGMKLKKVYESCAT
jgi:glycosyltransferase involved in cell wall biosynthesis